MERLCCFDKKVTNSVKGILLILMFILHFFCFPSWYVWQGYPHLLWLEKYQGHFQICVAGFTFLSGYLYFFSKAKNQLYIIKKWLDILIPYWIVLAVLLLIAVITNTYSGGIVPLIAEIFAVDGVIMVFNWYVLYYLMMIVALYGMVRIIKNDIAIWLSSIIGSLILYYGVAYFLPENSMIGILEKFQVYFPITITGYIFAKNRIFEKLDDLIKGEKLKIIIAIAMIAIVFMEPSWLYAIQLDNVVLQMVRKCIRMVSIPFFVYGVIIILTRLRIKVVDRALQGIGRHSLLMWFMHGIFFNCSKEIFQKILFLPYYPILVLIWGLLICYLLSVPLNYIVIFLRKKIGSVIDNSCVD